MLQQGQSKGNHRMRRIPFKKFTYPPTSSEQSLCSYKKESDDYRGSDLFGGSRLIRAKEGTGRFVLICQVLRCTRESLRIPQHRKVAVQGNFLCRDRESTLQIKVES